MDEAILGETDFVGFGLIQYPSLVQEFVDRLAAGIANLGLSTQSQIAIPIQSMEADSGKIYASPVALTLASKSDHSGLELAQQIVNAAGIQEQLSVDAKGWIYSSLSDGAIAGWLQSVNQIPPKLLTSLNQSQGLPAKEHRGVLLSEQLIFKLQYAHARCCSLLRLADRDHLLQLTEPNPLSSPQLWQLAQPTSIPWQTRLGKLRLDHPQEQLLLQQLLEFPGSLAGRDRYSYVWEQSISSQDISVTPVPWPPAAKTIERQMQLLCDRFEGFYRHCRIWGEVKHEQPELAIARLGLVVATHAVLNFCLQDLLDLDPALEL